ncbi:hypothetical protein I79_024733 [Cricetulus griseus]|uniref:Uncharacterized protein n=1 Tax=Cricetulus griseus TaxID=10029 RepID=G3ILG7_CRIGR|nr:hypothetical protein I79_024733 [Cricetulus griseus]
MSSVQLPAIGELSPQHFLALSYLANVTGQKFRRGASLGTASHWCYNRSSCPFLLTNPCFIMISKSRNSNKSSNKSHNYTKTHNNRKTHKNGKTHNNRKTHNRNTQNYKKAHNYSETHDYVNKTHTCNNIT